MLTTVVLGAAGLVGAASGALLAGAGYIVQQITSVPRGQASLQYGFTPWEMGITYEDVEFPAEDGATLRGWLLTRPDSDRVIMCLTGYRSQRSDVLGAAAALWRGGYNVFLFDYRGYGNSDGRHITLGHAETRDGQAALRWRSQRLPGAWIGALGYSMGGAVAIMAAAEEPDIRAVATDCAFARAEDLVRQEWRRRVRLPSAPFVETANTFMARLHGFRLSDIAPVEVIGRIAPRPLFLIHCTGDEIVPVRDVHLLFEAAREPKERWIIDDLQHCGGYFADRAGYMGRLIDFFDRAAADQGRMPIAAIGASGASAEDLHWTRPGGVVGAAL